MQLRNVTNTLSAFANPAGRVYSMAALFVSLSLFFSGCSSGGGNGGSGGSIQVPNIVGQPTNQRVPMGLSATFSVGVSGSPLNYQWMKNGTPVPGATSSSYTTPSTVFADTGAMFTATISNSLGSVTSSAATLTVTARAPQSGDLRFQQVDSPSTVNGYTGEEGTNLNGWGAYSFGNSTGTPLSIGPGCPAVGSDKYGCTWFLSASYLPAGMAGLGTYYQGFWLDDGNLETQLGNLSALNAVVTGLDVQPLSDTFAISWVQPSTSGAGEVDPWGQANGNFDIVQRTVASSNFQTEASQDGANGRVITAVSWDSGQILYFSYGWSRDTSTVYEVQVSAATFATVSSVAQQLAGEGYIITAAGGTTADGIFLVGTRVKGDTIPRPILIEDVAHGGNAATLATQGYAVVGFLISLDSSGNLLSDYWIGER